MFAQPYILYAAVVQTQSYLHTATVLQARAHLPSAFLIHFPFAIQSSQGTFFVVTPMLLFDLYFPHLSLHGTGIPGESILSPQSILL